MLEAPARGFPETEFAARTARAQDLMAKDGLSGWLFTTEPEIRYFTGFLTAFWQSPTRPWFLFVPAEGKPIAVVPEIGAALMESTWVHDIRTWPAPRPEDDGLSLLIELLAPLATENREVGILMGHETALRMPLADYDRLRAGLRGLRFRDATQSVRALRMTKSKAEIEKLAFICDVASKAFEQLSSLAHKGLPLVELFREFRIELLRQGADDVPYLVGGAGPGGYGDIISPPTQRKLQSCDVLMLDTGASWDGYFCDFDRNFAIETVGDAAKRAYETLWRATEAGLRKAQPGSHCQDVYRAMAQEIGGQSDVGRLGHGLGMQLTEAPSIAPFDDTVLEEGMVITLEPSIQYSDGLTMVHEENIVIRDNGPELLSMRASDVLPII